MALVLDTGPLVALVSRRDADHEVCRRLIESTTERLVIPAPVLVEVDWVLSSRGVPGASLKVLGDISTGFYRVEALEIEDYQRARVLLETYADSDMGFVDAAVLAVVERLGEPKLATLDHRHFGMMRPRHVQALRLLPA